MSAQPARRGDRRVERTRRVLRESLIALILERGWDGVTVQDVCDRADVGRSTFYTHFVDKEDLLVGGLDDLGKSLRVAFKPSGSSEPLGFARGLIAHVHEQRRLFRAIVGKRGGQVVQQRFRALLVEMIREDISLLVPAGADRDGAAHFIAGAMLEMLTWWLDARTPLPALDIERMFLRLARPAVAALGTVQPSP